MRRLAAQCELEGPRITGPITSLKMLGNFSIECCRCGEFIQISKAIVLLFAKNPHMLFGKPLTELILPALIAVFVLLGLILAVALYRDYLKHKNNLEPNSWTKTGFIGFLSNFLDTLGIGSFATETAMFKFFKQSQDRVIPGTLNVANAIPTIAQAIIYTQIVEVEPLTLLLMLLAAVIGSQFGAGVVAKLPEKKIQIIMGVALLITAGFLFTRAIQKSPEVGSFTLEDKTYSPGGAVILGEGDTVLIKTNGDFAFSSPQTASKSILINVILPDGTKQTKTYSGVKENLKGNLLEEKGEVGLSGMKLAIGVIANLILGALMTAGIGLYAPCMALVALLGMSAKTAFPIMMGSCAMLMPVAGLKFIKEGAYNRRASFAIAITGVFGVLIAAYIVKELPMEYLRWLVVAVVIYTSVAMLRSAMARKAVS